MKKAVKKMWVEALRSGQYKQTSGKLRELEVKGYDDNGFPIRGDTVGFCCLGVLCNLHAQTFPKHAKAQTDPSLYFGHEDFPPDIVYKWAGMKDMRGTEVTIDGCLDTLDGHNDNGRTFEEIADAIEKQL